MSSSAQFAEIKASEEAGAKLFIGNLRKDVVKDDVEDLFARYGRVIRTWVARKPPGIAFVWFEKAGDAEAAVKECNGKSDFEFAGDGGLRVEIGHNVSSDGGSRGARKGGGKGYYRGDSRRRGPPGPPPGRYYSRSRSRGRGGPPGGGYYGRPRSMSRGRGGDPYGRYPPYPPPYGARDYPPPPPPRRRYDSRRRY